MSIPKTTAVRALEGLSLLQRYLVGDIQRTKLSELLTSLKSEELSKLFAEYDIKSIGQKDPGMREEMLDAFCLLRDQRYGQRSRKHLYTQAYQSKLRGRYEAFMEFRLVNGPAVTNNALDKSAGEKTLDQLQPVTLAFVGAAAPQFTVPTTGSVVNSIPK